MTEDVLIRAATAADAEVLVELRARMLRELGADDERRLADLAARSVAWFGPAFADGLAAGWLAERGGRVVGGVSMTVLATQPQYRSLNGRVASVYGLFVEPTERGRGIASALVREALAFAECSGIDLVTLHAADQARPIYERLGFASGSEMRLFFGE